MALSTSSGNRAWQEGAAPEGIVIQGDPILRRVCAPVTDFTSVGAVAERMIEKLRELKGAGLAAPQVGLDLRLAIVEVRKTELFPNRPESPLYVLINPEIKALSSAQEEGWEGCFSIPGKMGKVLRFTDIALRYQDREGRWHDIQLSGYVARVVQHECDHLDGVLFPDRMNSTDSLISMEEYKRNHHQGVA